MSRDRKISVRSVMGGILCVIFIPVIFINLTLIISTYTKPGEMPGVFGIKPVIVLSGSMEPVIQTGDMIFLHSTDPARLQTGDVICYLDSGQAITHRIVGIREGGWAGTVCHAGRREQYSRPAGRKRGPGTGNLARR